MSDPIRFVSIDRYLHTTDGTEVRLEMVKDDGCTITLSFTASVLDAMVRCLASLMMLVRNRRATVDNKLELDPDRVVATIVDATADGQNILLCVVNDNGVFHPFALSIEQTLKLRTAINKTLEEAR